MTKIYFVRHCEALGNHKRLFQGVTDTDITELGAKQLEFLKERFNNIPIDKIYSSPLKRAFLTASAIKGDRDIPIEINDGLIELDGGIVEGKPFAETFKKYPVLSDAWDNHPEDFYPEGGESMRHAYERIYNTIIDIANKNRGKTVACASHGGVNRCLFCKFLKNDIHELKNMPWAENTAVSVFEIDENNNVNVTLINDTTHVPDEFLPKRSRLSVFMRKTK